ncbi:hypothetical protein [Streptomyces sp. N2A]|uniref:hypothetical protein n=1 Tax=Streptomyces sp. N2A TaxID=3073936 RepID=UPI0028709E84|nr:hypothetical protein [Streptomyces sp. N2A]
MSVLVYSFPTADERLCSVGARSSVPVGEGLALPGEVDLLAVWPDLAVRFRAAIAPGITVTLTEQPIMRYDCLRFTYPAETFRSVLACGLAALARRGIETVPPSKGPVCPVIPHDPLAAAIAEMIGPEGARRVKRLRTALRVQEEAQARRENVARAVAGTLYVSERTAHRLLRQARELGLLPEDTPTLADANDQEPATAADPPAPPPMLWR